MWIKFDNKDIDNQPNGNWLPCIPPEGYEVMVTDGENECIMWYVYSGVHEWFYELPDKPGESVSGDDIPFQPTHWMYLQDYKIYNRDKKIKSLIDG